MSERTVEDAMNESNQRYAEAQARTEQNVAESVVEPVVEPPVERVKKVEKKT